MFKCCVIFFINFFICVTCEQVYASACVSIGVRELNMRIGPGRLYPVRFVYKLKNLPLQEVSKFEDWTQVCDFSNDCGWVLGSMLSARKYLITLDNVVGRKEPFENARVVAKVGRNIILKSQFCKDSWCFVSVGRKKFWIKKFLVWGCKS